MDFSLQHMFADLEDPRQAGKVKHNLQEVILLSIIAVISNAQSWTQIEDFGVNKKEWLQQYFKFEQGIPTHDTIQRVFQAVKPEAIMACFGEWTQKMREAFGKSFVAIDGKTLRGSYNRHEGQKALHTIRAWATEQGLLLGHEAVREKSNEITAIPELLKTLMIKGCIVSIDAMGCQKNIVDHINEQQADYVIALKENQKNLYQSAVDWFEFAEKNEFKLIKQHDYAKTANKSHGRLEIRECWVITDLPVMATWREEGWSNLYSFIKVRRQRVVNNVSSEQISYYISSLTNNASLILTSIRRHWAIENECHWVLDVIFDEDRSRIRLGDTPQNFSLLRQMALSILKQDSSKGSLTMKRKRAALNDVFRLTLITNFHA